MEVFDAMAYVICLAMASFVLVVLLPVKVSLWGRAELLGSVETFLYDESQLEIQGGLQVSILWGAFKFCPKVKKPEGAPRSGQLGAGFKTPISGIRPFLARDVRWAFVRFGKRVMAATRFAADLHLTYGLEDPALAGLIYGAYQAVSGCLGKPKITLTPVFTEEMLDLAGYMEIQAIPILLLWHAFAFVMSSEIRPFWRGKFSES